MIKKRIFYLALSLLLLDADLAAQNHLSEKEDPPLTHADTLRGSLNPERTWWDVQHYAITVKPDYRQKTISGSNIITYKVVKNSYPAFMQIDLQEPMEIDSILFNRHRKLSYTREGNAFHVAIPKQKEGIKENITVYFHGKPREAIHAPWDGGWIWAKDSLGRPWMTVACQGLGASVWYPCKDHQSDEPDKGATLTIIAPDTLTAVGNGRMKSRKTLPGGLTSTTWEVVNPINNYTIVPYIGKYTSYHENYKGLKGPLSVTLWTLDYNIEKALSHSLPDVNKMLKAFEYWYGPYPFYEDGYQLVDAPHLGMEHQSAVAYGNHYLNGYLGHDLSQTGWGMKWDFIIVHESGHEWFANSITSKDIADMWIHESFTNYSETLFTEYYWGRKAGQDYCCGIRQNILNDKPIIAAYGVNREGSGDMYYKGANMINSIRNSLDNDALFRKLLHGLNKKFYHQTVTSKQIEDYISRQTGYNYGPVFNQYLRTTEVPEFQYAFSADKKKIYFRYTHCVQGFNLPIALQKEKTKILIHPSETWKSQSVTALQAELFTPTILEYPYYLTTKEVDVPEN